MCDRWRESVHAFIEDMGHPPDGHTLDRIDVNGPYSPENCRWATWDEQAKNRTSCRYVQHNGQRLTLTDFAKAVGVTYSALKTRVLRFGEDPIEAANGIIARREKTLTDDKIADIRTGRLSQKRFAEMYGISKGTVYNLQKGFVSLPMGRRKQSIPQASSWISTAT